MQKVQSFKEDFSQSRNDECFHSSLTGWVRTSCLQHSLHQCMKLRILVEQDNAGTFIQNSQVI